MSEKKVLLSPIGGTDPIANYRDGSLLHICRVYKPDVVYLYLSKEMCAFHEKDNRYIYCLDKLAELLDHKFEYEIILRPELKDVHDFDSFYEEFREIIREVREKYTEEFWVNVSSGTPAMKNALHNLTMLFDSKVTPIQVTTPEQKINPRDESLDNYDVEEYWELNEDNELDSFVDRTSIPKTHNQMATFAVNNIKKHIEAYDYIAALRLAEATKELMPDSKVIPEQSIRMLKIACARLKLDFSEFTKLNGMTEKLLPLESSDVRELAEYLLVLQIKVGREEYADFLRGISPIFFEIEKRVLEKRMGMDLSRLIRMDGRAPKWKDDLKNLDPSIYKVLDGFYGQGFKGGVVKTDHLTRIINHHGGQEAKLFDSFREIEEKVRNVAAHNIVAVTENWIKSECGYTPDEIMKKLRTLAGKAEIKMDEDDWDSYRKMNDKIIRTLQ